MRWGELLFQLTSTSKVLRASAVQEELLPFVAEATAFSPEDCRGIIGVCFGSVLGYLHDRHTRFLIEKVIMKATTVAGAAGDLCQMAVHTLGREQFALAALTPEAKAELLCYVCTLLRGVAHQLPKPPTSTVAVNVASLPTACDAVPALPSLVHHQLLLIHAMRLTADCHPAEELWTRIPILRGYALSAVKAWDPMDLSRVMPACVLLFALVSKAEGCSADILTMLLSSIGGALQQTKGPSEWAVWKTVPGASAFWTSLTAQQYSDALLPHILQALRKASHSTIPAVSSILQALPPSLLQLATAKDIIRPVVLGVKETDIGRYAANACLVLCRAHSDAELATETLKEITGAFQACKEIPEKTAYLRLISTAIDQGMAETTAASVQSALKSSISSLVLPALKTTVSGAPAEVRLVAYEVLLVAAEKAKVVPDYSGTVVKDVLQYEDEAVRRMALQFGSQAARLDAKKVELAVPAVKSLMAECEKKAGSRPDAALAALILICTKSLAKGDTWFAKGFLSKDAFLISSEALDRMSENPTQLSGVIATLEGLLPPASYLPKDLYDPLQQAQPIISSLLLLAASHHSEVRVKAQSVLTSLFKQNRNYCTLAYNAWKDTFAKLEEEVAPAKGDAKPSSAKPAPPAKGGKGAKPAPKTSTPVSTEADTKTMSSITAPVFPTSSSAVRQLFIQIVSTLLDPANPNLPKRLPMESFLLSGHPANVGAVDNYWHTGCGKYDEVMDMGVFNTLFGPAAAVADGQPSPKVADALERRKLLEANYDQLYTEVLTALASPQTELHISAVNAVTYLVHSGGPASLNTVLDHPQGLMACLDASAILAHNSADCRVYTAGKYGLISLVEKEVEEEIGGPALLEKKMGKLPTNEDERWEAEMMRKKAVEAGLDELAKKKEALRTELTAKYTAILNAMRPEVVRIKCGLFTLRRLVMESGCHQSLQGVLSLLVNALLPLLASELPEIIVLAQEVLERLLSISDIAPLAGRLSTLITRLVAGKHDPSRTRVDDDGALTDRTLPLLRLACQQGALSAASFSLMFPLLKAVLTKQKLVPPKKSSQKATAMVLVSPPTPAITSGTKPSTPAKPSAPAKSSAKPGPPAKPSPPQGAQILPGKGKELDKKGAVVKGKGGKDDRKPAMIPMPKPGPAAAVPATVPAAVSAPVPVMVTPVGKAPKAEGQALECNFQPVTRQLALSLLHNHCGLLDLQNRKEVVEVLVQVLEKMPALYRSTVQALTSITPNLHGPDIGPLLRALYNGNAMIKEAALGALRQYRFFMRVAKDSEETNGDVAAAPAADAKDIPEHEELKLLLFILSHDQDSDPVAKSARQLASLVDLQTPADYCTQLVPYLFHSEETIRIAAAAALPTALAMHPTKVDQALNELYSEHLKSILGSTRGSERIGVAYGLSYAKDHLGGSLPSVFEFLCAKALCDFRDDVRNALVNTGLTLITQWGKANHDHILPILKKYLDSPPVKGDLLDLYTSGVIVWMGAIGVYSTKPKDLLPVVDKLFAALNTPSEAVQRSISQCLGTLLAIPAMHSQHEKLVKNCLKKLITPAAGQASFAQKKGAAFGLAGIVKAGRLPLLKKLAIMQSIREAAEKSNPVMKEGGLIAVEVMCAVLGPLFEPYSVPTIDLVLTGFGDSNQDVKQAANDASRQLMKSLSEHGVRQVLPILLDSLDDHNWRTKCTAIELLGSMAYCSAKQLAACLPSIIPKLVGCLSDTHPKVSSTAVHSLRRVGGVIQNQEIARHVDVLLRALGDPAAETDNALEALMFTRFVTSVDAPALAIIYPILYRGLRSRVTSTKMKAAQIVGSLSQLLAEPSVMVPYIADLLPQLKVTLMDPIPEVRATTAKALGSLVKGLGEHRFHGLVPWLLESLKTEGAGVERAGAAQGLCEVIASLGVQRLEILLPELLTNCAHPKPHVKEGYLQVFVFLPHGLGTGLQPFLPKIMPRVLAGLSDDAEIVRVVSLRAGQGIVKLYGQSSLALLLPLLEEGLTSDIWRIRHSSLMLLGDLLMRVAMTAMPKKGKVKTKAERQEEEEDEEEEESVDEADEEEGAADKEHDDTEEADFNVPRQQMSLQEMKRMRQDKTANSVVECLRGIVGDHIEDIVADIYMLKNDQGVVRAEANTVWKALVDNTPAMLRKILPRLTNLLLACLSTSEGDQRQVAGHALGDLVGRLGDVVLPILIPELHKGLSSDEVSVRQGVALGFMELLQAANRLQLQAHAESLIPPILEGICDEDQAVQETAATAFDQLIKGLGPKYADDVVLKLVNKLDGDDEEEQQMGTSALVQLIGVRPKVVLNLFIPRVCHQQCLTLPYAQALAEIAEAAEGVMDYYIPQLLPPLIESLGHAPPHIEAIREAAIAIIRVMAEESVLVVMAELKTAGQGPAATTRRGAAALAGCLCPNVDPDYGFEERLPIAIQNVVRLFSDREEAVRDEAVAAMKAITESVEKDKDQLPTLMPVVHSSLMVAASGIGGNRKLAAFAKPKALDPVLPYYVKTLLGTNADAREAAARGLGELIEITPQEQMPKYVPVMVGPLLRIINEKMPPSARQAILETLGLLVENGGMMVKAFLPQLQSAYVKAINDEQSGTRLLGLRGLHGILQAHDPRADSILSDLNNQLKTQRAANAVSSLLRGISLVVVMKGPKVSQPIATTVATHIATLDITPQDVRLNTARGKCLAVLSSLTSPDLEEAVDEAIAAIGSNSATEQAFGLASADGLLQVSDALSKEQRTGLVNKCLGELTPLEHPNALFALRVMQKAIDRHADILPSNVGTTCVKVVSEILCTGLLHGTRLDRKALTTTASLARKLPAAFGAELPKIVAALLQKAPAKGDSVYAAMVTNALHWINKNVPLQGAKVPKPQLTALAEYTEEKTRQAAEDTETEEEKALLDYENA